jgi:hypothetical protein
VDISLRSCLTAGIATITATAVAFGPAVQQPAPAAPPPPVVQVVSPPLQLTAAVQPLAVADLPNLLVDWLERIIVPPSASQPFPTPPAGPGPAPTSIPSTLEWAYHAVEPWVRYGFELATYAAGWVPYVGWLSGQIMIFYNFGERIVHAITHNTLDWLSGNGSFLFNLGEGIAWTIDAFIQLGIDEWNFFLPPLPPLPFAAQAATVTTTATTQGVTTLAAADTTQLNEKHSAVVADEKTADESTDVVVKKPEVDAIKVANEPKEPKSTAVSAQGEVRGAPDTTDATKVMQDEKEGDKGPTAKGAADSSTSASDNTKKDDTSKKGKKE